eukprot:2992803-Rhodomonas_salina.1
MKTHHASCTDAPLVRARAVWRLLTPAACSRRVARPWPETNEATELTLDPCYRIDVRQQRCICPASSRLGTACASRTLRPRAT